MKRIGWFCFKSGFSRLGQDFKEAYHEDKKNRQRFLENAGKRATDFHNLQLENLDEPLEAVQMDELHGKTVKRKDKTEAVKVPKKLRRRLSKKRARLPAFSRKRWRFFLSS